MAQIVTLLKTKADEILGKSVISGSINQAGHLILTRGNTETIDGGDFTAIVTSIFNDAVAAKVAELLPAAVAGKVVDKGNMGGNVTFTEFTANNLVNASIRGVLTDNILITQLSLPANPKPGTQFAFRMKQDATGGRTLNLTGFKKSQGVLTLSTAPNAIDIVVFYFDGVDWYAGLMGDDFK